MQRTVQVPLPRLLEQISDGARVFVLGCGDCATQEGFGGAAECLELEQALEAEGVEVVGHAVPPEGDGICDPRVARVTLSDAEEALTRADLIVLLACPQGLPAVEGATDVPVIMGTQVVVGGPTGGGAQKVSECHFCEQCIAELTGGLCPYSFCPKHLINGPCGGAQGGRCEVIPERPCVWELIHRRLKAAGRLDVLGAYQEQVGLSPTGSDSTEQKQ